MSEDLSKSGQMPRVKGLLEQDEPAPNDNAPKEVNLGVILHAIQTRLSRLEKSEANLDTQKAVLGLLENRTTELFEKSQLQSEAFIKLQSEASVTEALFAKTAEDMTEAAKKAAENFSEEIAAAKRSLHEHTQLTAPVKLWRDKREEHVKSQELHQKKFQWSLFAIGALAISILLSVVVFPDLVDQLLTPNGCDPSLPETCKGFGSRSILVGATILTFLTALLWFTRLQMKLYLAERHLALDARERIAFSESYVGFLKEGDTSEEAQQQRSLVYAALFRPSSDGAIKEEGGLDPAISAAISKLLTK